MSEDDDPERLAVDFDALAPETFDSNFGLIPKVAFTGRRPPLHFDPPEHTHYRRAKSCPRAVPRSQRAAPLRLVAA